MTDEFSPTGSFRRPSSWPDWMPDARWSGGLASPFAPNDPARAQSGPIWWETPSGGLLALHPNGANWVETPNGGLLAVHPQSSIADRGSSDWWDSIAAAPSFGLSGAAPSTPEQSSNDDPFATAAARVRQSVRPPGGRREGLATKFLERYVPHVAEGLADLATLPGRAPVPMPQGSSITDTGDLLVNGQPAVETVEGRVWLEDQQKRIDWGPATALMLALAGIPRGAPRGSNGMSAGRTAASPALPVRTLDDIAPVVSGPEMLTLDQAAPLKPALAPLEWDPQRPSSARVTPIAKGELFDRSHQHEVPPVPQHDLLRYEPPRGVPEHILALANPANLERLNQIARIGLERGGHTFPNVEPFRQETLARLGTKEGQADFELFMNLVAAMSPRSAPEAAIRRASYYKNQIKQELPVPGWFWDAGQGRWRLTEPLPRGYGHIDQGLHAKKVSEILEHGKLDPLRNPKLASEAENLMGNHIPVPIDRVDARHWPLTNARGNPVDVPPQNAYGFLEGVHQTEAAKMGLSPAQRRGAVRFGGAEQIGMRSRPVPLIDVLEYMLERTAKSHGLTKDEMLRRLIDSRWPPLFSAGAAAGAGAASLPVDDESDRE